MGLPTRGSTVLTITLAESKLTPDGSFACVSVGASDRAMNETKRGTAVDLVRLRQASVAKSIRALGR